MKLVLDEEHPLTQGIMSATPHAGEVWLVLKSPGSRTTFFRACLTEWTAVKDSGITATFESWEKYMERKAQLAGL